MISSRFQNTIFYIGRSRRNRFTKNYPCLSSPQNHSTAYFSSSSVAGQSRNNDTIDSSDQSTKKKGVIVEKSPVRILCEEGKTYSWCACGLSLKQPLCDGTHKKSTCGLKPFRFTAPQTKEYSFCNCKQTNKPPFCDGTHKKLCD